MRWWVITGYGLSAAVHFGLAAGVTSIPKQTGHKATAVTVFDAKPKKEKAKEPEKKEKPPEPPKPVTVPKQVLKIAAEPPPVPDNTPPPPTNASPTPAGHPAMAAMPDFGISMGGGVGGGGIAVPVGGGGTGGRVGSSAGGGTDKRVHAAAPKPTDSGDGCVEEQTKPKSIDRVQAQYTDEARSANVEGVVSVEFRVGADGSVIDARILKGLGHGLDQSALAAAKRWKFSPSMRCGKAVESKHVVSMRFQLGD